MSLARAEERHQGHGSCFVRYDISVNYISVMPDVPEIEECSSQMIPLQLTRVSFFLYNLGHMKHKQ